MTAQPDGLWGRRAIVSAGAIPGAELQRHRTQPRLLVQVDSRTLGVNRYDRAGRFGIARMPTGTSVHQGMRFFLTAVMLYVNRGRTPFRRPSAHRNACLNDLILPLTKRTQHAAACAPHTSTRPSHLPTGVPLAKRTQPTKPGPHASRPPARRSAFAKRTQRTAVPIYNQ